MEIFIFVILALIFSLISITELIIIYYSKNHGFENPDLIVVLGCGNRTDKPLLNDRLELAIQSHYSYPNVPILLTGDEKNKLEISSMSKYLKSKIPNANVITDPHSLRTWDSFMYIKNNYADQNLLIVTNEFHQRRSIFFARYLELSAKTSSKDLTFSNTWYFFIRERLARLLIYRHFI